MKAYPYVFRPMLITSAGGAANEIHGGFRDRLQQRFGCVPDCIKSLAIDYSTDPPTGFSPSETGVLALPGDCPAIAARMLTGEPDVAWLCPIILPDVLAGYAGHEAAQVPAFTRAALPWTSHNGLGDGQPTWLDLLRSHLMALAPGGVALHDMVARASIPASAIDHAGAILAVFIARRRRRYRQRCAHSTRHHCPLAGRFARVEARNARMDRGWTLSAERR